LSEGALRQDVRRAEADTVDLTREFLAVTLSARRADVNVVGNTFRKAGLIR
jgi:hypothetical protein